jgi:hypothetical protein
MLLETTRNADAAKAAVAQNSMTLQQKLQAHMNAEAQHRLRELRTQLGLAAPPGSESSSPGTARGT